VLYPLSYMHLDKMKNKIKQTARDIWDKATDNAVDLVVIIFIILMVCFNLYLAVRGRI